MIDTASMGNSALRDYIVQADSVRGEATALAGELTREQFNWRPDATRWSVGQCLQHITLTLRLYPAEIERMIVEARQREARGERPYREGMISRMVVNGMEPPPKMRVRTRKMVVPPQELDPLRVLADFDAAHVQLAELIAAADGVSLRHGRMRSPFFPLAHFTLGQVFRMNLAHARRHLWQAREVMRAPGFPGQVPGNVSSRNPAPTRTPRPGENSESPRM